MWSTPWSLQICVVSKEKASLKSISLSFKNGRTRSLPFQCPVSLLGQDVSFRVSSRVVNVQKLCKSRSKSSTLTWWFAMVFVLKNHHFRQLRQPNWFESWREGCFMQEKRRSFGMVRKVTFQESPKNWWQDNRISWFGGWTVAHLEPSTAALLWISGSATNINKILWPQC